MASTKEILGVQLNLVGMSPQDFQPLAKGLEASAAGFRTTMGKAIQTTASQLEDNIQSALGKAIGHGVKDIDKLQKAFYASAEPLLAAQRKALELEDQLEKAVDSHTRLELKNKIMGLKVVSDEYQKLHAAQLKAETAVFDRRIKLADEYNEYFAQSFEEKFEQASDGLGAMLNNVVTLNLKDAFKQGGKFFSTIGAGAATKGQAAGGSGNLGKSVEMLGKSLLVIGGLAAGFALLVKTLIDADNQAKDWNKEIITAAGAMDVMGKEGRGLTESLETIRAAAVNATSPLRAGVSAVMKLGLTTKEYLGVFNKFQEMGVTMDQMKGSAKNVTEEMENYTKYVRSASTYSRMFGEDLNTTAEKMGDYMKDLGLNLDEVSRGFATIAEEAQKSGFGTKRFYNMVLQATSGQTMYNLRLAGTAKLLTSLTRVLGGKAGGNLLQSLMGAVSGESYQDRVKRIMTTGKGTMKGIIGTEASRQASGIGQAFRGKSFSTEGMSEGAASIAGKLGTASEGQIIKMLASISAEDRRSLVSSLSTVDADLSKRLDSSIDAIKGTSGTTADMMKAMEQAGPGAKMLMEIKKMQGVIGKPLDKMNMFEKMAYQQQTGMSSEMIAQLERVQRTANGDFENAKRMLDAVKDDSQMKEMNAKLENTGMEIRNLNGTYKLVGKENGQGIKNGDDALANMDESNAKKEESAADKQLRVGEETAQNTMKLTDLMENTMLDVMNEIASYVGKILDWLGLRDTKTDLKPVVESLQKDAAQRKKLRDQEILDAKKKKEELKKQLGGESNEGRRKIIQDGIAAAETVIRTKGAEQRLDTEQVRGIGQSAKSFGGSQQALYQKLLGAGVDAGGALTKVSGMSEEESKKALEDIAKQGKEASDATKTRMGGMASADFHAREDAAAAEKKAAAQMALDVNLVKLTKDQTTELEQSKGFLKGINDKLEQQERDARAKDLKEALGNAGFSEDQLGAFGGGGSSDQYLKDAVQNLKNSAPASWGANAGKIRLGSDIKKRFSVDDAIIGPQGAFSASGPGTLITPDGKLITGSGTDTAMFVDAKSARGGGGGGANVSIVINATAGREDQVRQKVYEGLKDYYRVMTGAK